MILTNKQEEGLKIAINRYRQGEKFTIISGYAGSGKSTLVRFIINALDVEEDKVCYCAFTGKAAEVLRKKGNKNVCTLHKLLYDHVPRPTGGFFRKPKLFIPYNIIIVDEVSMAPKELINLLFTHPVYVICLGDPFQLPPIEKEDDNELLYHPHIFLDEIMRQAQESEIIRLTMQIRENKELKIYNGNEVKVLSPNNINTGILQWGDQIITATNIKRQSINAQMRQLLGRYGEPVEGDKMICLRNYWDDLSEQRNPLINGTIGYIQNGFKTWRELPYFVKKQFKVSKLDTFATNLYVPETNDIYHSIEMDYNMILTGEKSIDWRLSYALGRLKPKYGDMIPKEFDFAYAITCHKSQGSEWDKVVVIEENFPFIKHEHARWLYTACTRASEKLVLINKE